MKLWLLSRLREASTWRGIVWILTFVGVVHSPEQGEAIMTAGMAIVGLLGVFLSDDRSTDSAAVPLRSGSVIADVGADVSALPEIELVGRATAPPVASKTGADAHDADLRAGPVRSADRMRVPPHYPAEHDERSGTGWNG